MTIAPGSSKLDNPAPVVLFNQVRTRFGNEQVLDGITFDVARGEFLSLLGPSGCGKSTTLRILGNLLKDYEGTVLIDGQLPALGWRKLAFVFQSPRLVPWRTALSNIELGLELRLERSSVQERRDRAMACLDLVALGRDGNKYPGMMSGGERQRVSIARALAIDPEIILMDEPLSALDIQTKSRLRQEILRIWQETQKTVIYVTHDIDEALYFSDRILVLSKKPTRVLRTYAITQGRPRSADDDELRSIKEEIARDFQHPVEALEADLI